MGRRQQTTILIFLTAMTLMPAYALQGWLASGHNADELPFWFWVAETVAWSARALIEAGAILYLFRTQADSRNDQRALLFFKFALITLITFTLGPVVASVGLGMSLSDALPRPLFWGWSFAVASYVPLMLGAVGVAYRIMPNEPVAINQDDNPAPEPTKGKKTAKMADLSANEPISKPVTEQDDRERLANLEAANKAKQEATTEKTETIHRLTVEGLTRQEIADELDCSLATVTRHRGLAKKMGLNGFGDGS